MKQLNAILFSLALILSVSTSAWAQQSDNADINASATVVAQVSVTGVTDLEFDQVSPGVTKTLDSDGTVSAGTESGGEQVGVFGITKGENTQVNLSFTLPTDLSDGTNNLAIEFATTAAALDDGSSQTTFDPNSTFNVTSADNSSYFAASNFEVHLGGTVNPTIGQIAGIYNGTVTLTATYN